ncbi:Alpha/Beta hydrolase protein [Mycena sanguinolenta]|nr:Alpha/Beta hydrolase protein [Mycena sanguinolenta]
MSESSILDSECRISFGQVWEFGVLERGSDRLLEFAILATPRSAHDHQLPSLVILRFHLHPYNWSCPKMDAVAAMQETAIQTILFPTIGVFAPLLEPKREEITKARKTFKYGETDRHHLDVYYPPNTGKKHPLLFYVYGGGFVSGARTLPVPADLGYGNVGLYFAVRGFVTIIADYRLAPQATYPASAEDVPRPDADTTSVFLVGHSAGGVHVLTLLLAPSILTAELRAHLKGVVIASAPCHYDVAGPENGERERTTMYYGSSEAITQHSPLALLQDSSKETVGALPPLVMIICERDPEWFKIVGSDFRTALAEKGTVAPLIAAEGHNHISLTFALSTGQGEKWAEDIVSWIEGKL